MYDEKLYRAILRELNRSFPRRLSIDGLKQSLPAFSQVSEADWLMVIDALHQDGFVGEEGLIYTDQIEGLTAVFEIGITAAGRRHVMTLAQQERPVQSGSPPRILSEAMQRMHLAILFTDIEGSHRLNKEMGDAKWGALRSEHFEVARNCIERNAGECVKTAGDSVLAVFRAASSAVRCAVDLMVRMTDFNTSRSVGNPILLRVGIHVGEVEVRDRDVFGGEVNVTARLRDMANGGQILCTPCVKRAADGLKAEWSDRLQWRDHGETTLKGDEPTSTQIWELGWQGPTAAQATDQSMSAAGEAVTITILGAGYTPEFNGVILSAEICNLGPESFQLTDWLLDLPPLGLTLAGGPGNPKLVGDEPWWKEPPFDLAAKKMSRGAVFFKGLLEWRNSPPQLPLQGKLIAKFFPPRSMERIIEIHPMPPGRSEAQPLSSSDGEPFHIPNISDPTLKSIVDHYTQQGVETCLPLLEEKDVRIARGFQVAPYPGTHREVWVGFHGGRYEHILMIKPKQPAPK